MLFSSALKNKNIIKITLTTFSFIFHFYFHQDIKMIYLCFGLLTVAVTVSASLDPNGKVKYLGFLDSNTLKLAYGCLYFQGIETGQNGDTKTK